MPDRCGSVVPAMAPEHLRADDTILTPEGVTVGRVRISEPRMASPTYWYLAFEDGCPERLARRAGIFVLGLRTAEVPRSARLTVRLGVLWGVTADA